jgi:hypothetical protein
MKCAICGIQIDSVEKAIGTGWIPYVWDGDREQDGPFCPSCCESLIEIDDDGEYVVKDEYQGKIAYQEGDFGEDQPEDNLIATIVFDYCEN